MIQPTVIFSHGHLSSPQSNKILELTPVARNCGFDVEAIDYRDLRDDPVGRSERLIKRIAQLESPVVLVGSSMGGYVSMAAAETTSVAGLFLLAPALYLEHYVEGGVPPETYHPRTDQVTVIHGWRDDTIPWRNSLKFAEQSKAALHLFDAGHDLHDYLPEIAACLTAFLRRLRAESAV